MIETISIDRYTISTSMDDDIRNKPNVIIVMMLKYSPILYFFNSPETRLINITTAVEIRIKILKNCEKGS